MFRLTNRNFRFPKRNLECVAKRKQPNATESDPTISIYDRERVDLSMAKFLDGRFYFPEDSVDWDLVCAAGSEGHRNPYGRIDWFDVRAGGRVNQRAAWRFRQLRRPYASLSGFTAFWKGVRVSQASARQLCDKSQEGDDGQCDSPEDGTVVDEDVNFEVAVEVIPDGGKCRSIQAL